MLDVDVVNEVKVIVKVSLIVIEGFYDESDEVSNKRVINVD